METNIYTQIQHDSNLQAKLMLEFNKTYSTIYRWARERHIMLTTEKALKIIEEHNKGIEAAKSLDIAEL